MILAFIPAEIRPNTLNTMTAFAVRRVDVSRDYPLNVIMAFQTGGLLSDVFLHLVPHSFLGESQGPDVRFVLVEEKRNILVGSVPVTRARPVAHNLTLFTLLSEKACDIYWLRRLFRE